jgi:hypothetical protein
MCVWIQKLIVNFISLSLKKKESNDFTFALSCFLNIRLFLSLISILYESRWYFADSAIYMCAHLVTYIYICITNDQTEVTTWPSHCRFCLKKRGKKDKTRLSNKIYLPLCHSVRTYSFRFYCLDEHPFVKLTSQVNDIRERKSERERSHNLLNNNEEEDLAK